jgi:hypothetical protein
MVRPCLKTPAQAEFRQDRDVQAAANATLQTFRETRRALRAYDQRRCDRCGHEGNRQKQAS